MAIKRSSLEVLQLAHGRGTRKGTACEFSWRGGGGYPRWESHKPSCGRVGDRCLRHRHPVDSSRFGSVGCIFLHAFNVSMKSCTDQCKLCLGFTSSPNTSITGQTPVAELILHLGEFRFIEASEPSQVLPACKKSGAWLPLGGGRPWPRRSNWWGSGGFQGAGNVVFSSGRCLHAGFILWKRHGAVPFTIRALCWV